MKYCKNSLQGFWGVLSAGMCPFLFLCVSASTKGLKSWGWAERRIQIQHKHHFLIYNNNNNNKKRYNPVSTAEKSGGGCGRRRRRSQLWQLVDGRVELEVWREELCSARVDETVRLSDGDVGHAGDVPDFWERQREQKISYFCLFQPQLLALTCIHLYEGDWRR